MRSVIHDVCVGIPLDVCNFGSLRHYVVENRVNIVLNLRICEVEHHLCAAAPLCEWTVGTAQCPIGMFFEKFALCVYHFGFNPDSELYVMFFSIVCEGFDAVWQFLFAHHPVAKTCMVVVARVFVAKPTVVHNEKFASERCYVAHHLVHGLFIDVEIYTFPGIKENHSFLVAVSECVFACPAVESPTYAAFSLCRVGHDEFRCSECLTSVKYIA